MPVGLQDLDFDLDGLVCRLDRRECVPDGYFGGRQITRCILGICAGDLSGSMAYTSRNGTSRLTASSTAHSAASSADREPSMPTTTEGGE